MAGYPDDLRYTDTHEWVRARDAVVTFGLTEVAAERLGSIGFVELPYAGEIFRPGDTLCRARSDAGSKAVLMPFTGKIIAVNQALSDEPGPVNADPYGAGWLVRIEPGDAADVEALMDAAAYEAFVAAAGA